MLDPYWIGGKAAYAKRTELAWLFILRNDPVSPAAVRLQKDEALRILETGEASGAKKSLSPGQAPAVLQSPSPLHDEDRLELQKGFFGRLLDSTCPAISSTAGWPARPTSRRSCWAKISRRTFRPGQPRLDRGLHRVHEPAHVRRPEALG